MHRTPTSWISCLSWLTFDPPLRGRDVPHQLVRIIKGGTRDRLAVPLAPYQGGDEAVSWIKGLPDEGL